MTLLEWVEQALKPSNCTSEEFFYDHMASQSGRCLPIIYQPFDVDEQAHWSDRGWLYDFLHSTGGGNVLDFGPGDGWPSLILAPFVDEVVGVEGSHRRVKVCRENAQRLGLTNVRFVYVEPGTPLPFDKESFDSVTAASSVEQTPDPCATLCELYRVLRPGGRLRVSYEALSRYRGGAEQEAGLLETGNDTSRLILYDRRIDEEHVVHYGLDLDLPRGEAVELLSGGKGDLCYADLTVTRLRQVRDHIVEALTCTLTHPSGATLVSWLEGIGFREVHPCNGGGWYAWRLYERLPEERRPRDLASLDAYLSPLVAAFVQFAAPLDMDPPIMAVK